MKKRSSLSADPQAFLDRVINLRGMTDLFRTLPQVHFYVKNSAGQFMAANTASLLRNGLHEESEILGKTDFDFHPPEMAAGYQAEDRQVMHARQPLLNQVWLVYDHLNIQQWFVSSKIPLMDQEGAAIGIAGAMQPLAMNEGPSPYQRFADAIHHVMKHHGEKLRVPELAKMSKLSVSQFDRQFRKLFSMSPTQYIMRVRVNGARRLLSSSDQRITQIAMECGFYDQAQLTRSFKRLTGMTPSAYRQAFEVSSPLERTVT